jgi:hypothetical protein
MAATPETKNGTDTAREHLARARRLRADMIRSGNAVVHHLRRAAELRRRAARNGR